MQITLASPDFDKIRKQAKEWASVLQNPYFRDMAEEAAEIILQAGFDLPEIKERDLGKKTKAGFTTAAYNSMFKQIFVNNNKDIKKAGDLRKMKKDMVAWGAYTQDNTILHELCHYIDDVLNPEYNMPEHEWNVELSQDFVKKNLSIYGVTNRAEYEAELLSGILRGKVYPKEIMDHSYVVHFDDERAKKIVRLGNGEIPNDSGMSRDFDNMMKAVHQEAKKTKEATDMLKLEKVQQFIERHKLVLDNAVDVTVRETPLDEISVQRLKESNYVFSGIKTFHELKEAFPSLVGTDGNIKPFEQFLAEVRRVHKTYNRQYLQAEYHLAQSSASMAARWKKFEKDGDRYLLQYRTIGDKRVRPTHRDLHGITLPINSKFWDEYFPPNNWNCRCSVVQVRRSKYTQSDEAEAMRLGLKATAGKYREMFLFNPGKTMTCFPMYNAYTRKACINCKKKPGNLELAADVPDNELCRACKIIREIETERLRIKERRKEYREKHPV